MSKTVTIPTWSNPFVVSINDKEYTYPAGATVEVPDEVAAAIEAATRKKEPAPTQPPFISSWNDLTDKPFGEVGGDTLTWDGNTEGLVNFDGVYFKVSDAVFTQNDLANGLTLDTNTGEGGTLSFDELVDMGAFMDSGLIYTNLFFCVPYDGFDVGAAIGGSSFPLEQGVYFVSVPGIYATSLTIPGYTGFPVTKKLDEKYMPLLSDSNGKQYKLTVSTDGTLSATAV